MKLQNAIKQTEQKLNSIQKRIEKLNMQLEKLHIEKDWQETTLKVLQKSIK